VPKTIAAPGDRYRLADPYLIRWDVIPAALLAILTELAFEGIEKAPHSETHIAEARGIGWSMGRFATAAAIAKMLDGLPRRLLLLAASPDQELTSAGQMCSP
jgi:hypothetical protein